MAIGVIGSGEPSRASDPTAYEVGMGVARSGALLVCGGLSGVMEAASRGAREAGGQVLGFLPGAAKEEANPHVTIAVPTGMGVGRNLLVVRASDALIALRGGSGTFSEIALALHIGLPVVDLGGWKVAGTIPAADPQEAIALALARAHAA